MLHTLFPDPSISTSAGGDQTQTSEPYRECCTPFSQTPQSPPQLAVTRHKPTSQMLRHTVILKSREGAFCTHSRRMQGFFQALFLDPEEGFFVAWPLEKEHTCMHTHAHTHTHTHCMHVARAHTTTVCKFAWLKVKGAPGLHPLILRKLWTLPACHNFTMCAPARCALPAAKRVEPPSRPCG